MKININGHIEVGEEWEDTNYLREHLEYLFMEYLQGEGISFKINEWIVIDNDNRHNGE
mgnify:CR=1 FL=1|jgi:hypothetical protein|tara:strand:+ start:2523 stop:2696 length:174 start_codon:yes stop_codon:yes gene_type:complete